MIIFTFAVSSVLVIMAFNLLSSRMFKSPEILLALGIVTSALSMVVKSLPILLKNFPKIDGWITLDIAASTVDPTLIGLSGGLIASAFILKIQNLYESEKVEVADERQHIQDWYARLKKEREDIELAEGILPSEEIDRRSKHHLEALTKIIEKEQELEKRIRKLDGK